MPKKYTGKTTTSRVERRRPNGDIYVYEEERKYDQEKKYAKTISSKLIGVKKKGTDKIVPTREKRKFVSITKEEVDPLGDVKAVRKHVGMMDIIDHMAKTSGVDEDMRLATDLPTANKILSLARYVVCNDSHGLAGIEEWQYTHNLPYDDGINKNIYHNLFKEIGRDETLQQAFFKFRLEREEEACLYLACDSSMISTYSDNLTDDIARYGYDKEKDGLPKVKYLVLFSLRSNMPVWFKELPGNISDIVTITSVIDELKALGVKKVTLITDNGYYSEQNLGEMIAQGYDFITLADINVDWIKNEVNKFYKTVQNIVYACPHDVDTHGLTWPITRDFEWTRTTGNTVKKLKKRKKVYLHIFFNPERKIDKDREVKNKLFEAKLQLESGIKLEDMKYATQKLINKCCNIKYDDNNNITEVSPCHYNFEQYCKYHGIFVLISNRDINCFECLSWYRRREKIEDFFRRAKGDINMERTAVWDKDTLHGRMLVQFVALCLYQHTENKIFDIKNALLEKTDANGKEKLKGVLDDEKKLWNWLDSRSIVRILNWFDAYDRVDISVKLRLKRWSTPNTERDRLFLQKLGVIPNSSK